MTECTEWCLVSEAALSPEVIVDLEIFFGKETEEVSSSLEEGALAWTFGCQRCSLQVEQHDPHKCLYSMSAGKLHHDKRVSRNLKPYAGMFILDFHAQTHR